MLMNIPEEKSNWMYKNSEAAREILVLPLLYGRCKYGT